VNCGGGTRTRTVTCSSSIIQGSANNCAGQAQPVTTEACNTASCGSQYPGNYAIDCIQGSIILESSLSRTFQGQTPQPSTCSSACIASMRGNGVCDQECYNLNCNYDDGDCITQLLPGSMLCCNFAEMYLRIIFQMLCVL
jgi:hypothetical protein